MVILHIAHYWPGGLVRWVTDHMAGNEEPSYLINWDGTEAVYGQRYFFYDGSGKVLDTFVPTTKIIEKIDLVSAELYQWVLKLVKNYHIDAMYVSTLFGYSLDLLDLPIKKVIILHDFVYVCAGTFGYFNQPCQRCHASDLKKCIASNPATNLYGGVSYEKFVSVRNAFVSRANSLIFVAPTQDTASRICKIEPRLSEFPINVVPHGLSTEFLDCFGGAVPGRKLRLVFLGRHLWYKGWAILEKVLPDYKDQIDIYVMGCGESGYRVAQAWAKEIIPSYEQQELPEILRRIAPDVGLVFPLVPETYSYTLTELLHARIPVIASQVGALCERVNETFGFLIAPSAEQLRIQLDALLENRELLLRAHQTLITQQRKTAHQMSQEYEVLLQKFCNQEV